MSISGLSMWQPLWTLDGNRDTADLLIHHDLSLLEYHPTGPVLVLAVLEHISPPLLPIPNFSDADPPRHALVLAQVFGMLWEGR